MKPAVAFITPPSPFLLDERVFPSLGILKVAAVAEKLGYPVEHLDLNGVKNYTEVVIDYCVRTDTRIFALTATTPQMPAATKIRNIIRAIYPMARIIIGGPHPTLTSAAMMKSERAAKTMGQLLWDYNVVVAGDGELAIELALDKNTPNFIDADDPKAPLFLKSNQLADQPFPARHLIDLNSYHYSIENIEVTAIIGQLGCPFGCFFCAGRDTAMLRRVRLRPVDNIIQEMRQIYRDYGIHGFMFFDDELNVNKDVLTLLNAMDDLQDELGVEFRCRGFVKAELFNEEQAKVMYRVGFRRIMCGFESGSDRILKNINKNATKDDNTRAMEISHKYNLQMKALMSVGHAGESERTIEETRKWLLEVMPSDFDVTIITAYPGSPYYDRAVLADADDDVWKFEVNGDRLYMIDTDYTQIEDFYKGSLDGYKSYVFTDYLTTSDLVVLRDQVEKDVRGKLGIPFYQAGRTFEASIGMMPGKIYRKSEHGVSRSILE